MTIKISPSILSADFAMLGEEVRNLTSAGADMLHIDVMDGHFVPNITIGPAVIKSIKKHTNLPFDVHLMVNSPEHLIEDFISSGSDIVTIHFEAVRHPDRVLSHIKSCGAKAGISLLPTTPIDVLDYLWNKIDLILIMTVNPGFGGQEFMENQLSKIQAISSKLKSLKYDNILLSVDGGINPVTAEKCTAAGASVLVAGNYILGHKNYTEAINNLRNNPMK
jgi:ribulose-phosphate 3-epimerase